MNISKLLTRSISGAVYVALIVACLLLGETTTTILALVFAMLGMLEYTKITSGISTTNTFTKIIDVCICMVLAIGTFRSAVITVLICMLIRVIIELSDKNGKFSNLATSAAGIIWIGLPLGILSYIAYVWHPHILLLAFILIWVNDTGAFLTGSSFGKHRLCERLSPKKSWEGFFGGLILDIAVAAVLGIWCPDFFDLNIPVWQWMILGALISLLSTWGDLLESMLKRNLNIKDSGNLIPGHGGILDRIDSLLFVLPGLLIFLYYTLM